MSKVTVVTYHPYEDEVQVVGVLQKATKANIKKLLQDELEEEDVQVRIQPGTDIVETRQCYDGDWDEWDEIGCYETSKQAII
jgi:hypothetical protein